MGIFRSFPMAYYWQDSLWNGLISAGFGIATSRCRQEPDSDDELYDETQEIPETLGAGQDVDSQGVSNVRSPGSNRWVGTGLYHMFGLVLGGSSLT